MIKKSVNTEQKVQGGVVKEEALRWLEVYILNSMTVSTHFVPCGEAAKRARADTCLTICEVEIAPTK